VFSVRDFWVVASRSYPGRNVQIENINDTPDVIRQRRVKDQAIFFPLSAYIEIYTPQCTNNRNTLRGFGCWQVSRTDLQGIYYYEDDEDGISFIRTFIYTYMGTTMRFG